MERVLAALRAAAEPSRLRLLALCARSELTVTQLTQVLGQSQPSVSRHLKLLCEAGLIDRFPEGSAVFYRIAQDPLSLRILRLLPEDDATLKRDLARLGDIERERERAAARYFAANAHQWDALRALQVPDREVESVLLERIVVSGTEDLLDIGTGTGRMLELFGARVRRGVGIDRSRDMLAIARINLERANLRNCVARYGDMYALPFTAPSFDLILLHQVLHYADRPADAVLEAARVLRPGGRLVIVDVAPHDLEALRRDHAHRRLGFADTEISEWLARAGLDVAPTLQLPGNPLTVSIWDATARAAVTAPSAVQADPISFEPLSHELLLR
jgi:ArsR family transcriptional regulator